MRTTKQTTIRLNPTNRDDLKEICKARKTSMSTAIRTLVLLFLNDVELQDRVVREIQRQ